MSSQETTRSIRVQVLNISNTNTQNEIVLNDELLLQLVYQHPFLYNPFVHPYKNVDYTEWAWERITTVFNKNYKDISTKSFTIDDLQQRWQELIPIVKSLSKASDLGSIPSSIGNIINKISLQFYDEVVPPQEKPLTKTQKELQSNLDWIEKLPMEKRCQLQAEIINLILDADLEAYGTVKVGAAEKKLILQECRDFLQDIELEDLEPSEFEAAPTPVSANDKSKEKIPSNGIILAEENVKIKIETESEGIFQEKTNEEWKLRDGTVDNEYILPEPVDSVLKQLSQNESSTNGYEQLLCSVSGIKQCKVRLTRNDTLEQYIPLSQLKREPFVWYS